MNAASVLRHSAKHRNLVRKQAAFKAYKLSEARHRVLGTNGTFGAHQLKQLLMHDELREWRKYKEPV